MTFKEILDLTKNLINQTDTDAQVDIIVKAAINNAYMNELGKEDKRVTRAFIPIINGIATLPDDIMSIESITPALLPGESRIGNSIFTSQEGTFTLVYSYVREPLVAETDEPDINKKYLYAMALYGAYGYYKHRKKFNEEQSFYAAFRQAVDDLKPDDVLPTKIKNVYTGGMW